MLPTPAVAWFTVAGGADLGIAITASHNPPEDNGIKVLLPGGLKTSPADEADLEARIAAAPPTGAPAQVRARPDAVDRYVTAAVVRVSAGGPLKGLRLVVDCANGATTRTATRILTALGADVKTPVGSDPDGAINDGCGTAAPRRVARGRARGRRSRRPRVRRRRRPRVALRRDGRGPRRRPRVAPPRAPTSMPRAPARPARGGDGDVELRARGGPRRPRTSCSTAPPWATVTSRRACARPARRSAASSRGTCCSRGAGRCSATAWWRASRRCRPRGGAACRSRAAAPRWRATRRCCGTCAWPNGCRSRAPRSRPRCARRNTRSRARAASSCATAGRSPCCGSWSRGKDAAAVEAAIRPARARRARPLGPRRAPAQPPAS